MVELRKIDKDNFDECIKLNVSDDQKNFVASNVYSLAQAWANYETAYPFAIYADGEMAGFVMMGYYTEKGVYTIWRFMIDKGRQNMGYGKEALRLSVEYLREKHGADEIFLSFVPGNTVAERMYSNAGFERTGEVDDGEIIMRLGIK